MPREKSRGIFLCLNLSETEFSSPPSTSSNGQLHSFPFRVNPQALLKKFCADQRPYKVLHLLKHVALVPQDLLCATLHQGPHTCLGLLLPWSPDTKKIFLEPCKKFKGIPSEMTHTFRMKLQHGLLFASSIIITIVLTDIALFKNHALARLITNIGIVAIYCGIYLRFFKK